MELKNVRWIFLFLGCLVHVRQCDAELKLIQAVFRHGHRTPMAGIQELYPNDPYYNKTYEPVGHGALTNTGKLAAYRLGEFLRTRYGRFVGPVYSPKLIRFQADEVERVIMTGQLVAAGMFPPVKIQKWHPFLDWQPVPIWTTPLDGDILFNSVFCSNYKKMRQELEATDKFLIKRKAELQEFLNYLSYHTGNNVTHMHSFYLRQQLFAEKDVGLTLPEWTRRVFPGGELDKVASFDVVVQSYTNEMKQLMGGLWIREFLNHVDDLLSGKRSATQKAFMYPAHEYNIGGILVALNNYDFRIPNYVSCVVFELHQIGGAYFVQVLHKEEGTVRLLNIPGCIGSMCPLDMFRVIHQPVIIKDEKTACGTLEPTLF